MTQESEAAKRTKQVINGQRIYPPLTGYRAEILAAAEPVVQKAPEVHSWGGSNLDSPR